MSVSTLLALSVLIPTAAKWGSHNAHFMGLLRGFYKRVYAVTDIQQRLSKCSFFY